MIRSYGTRFIAWLMIVVCLGSLSLAQSGRNRANPKPKEDTTTKTTPTTPTNKPPVVYENASEASEDVGVLKIDATLVTVPTVVSDRSGRYVPFLQPKDFNLYEDSIAQEISFFSSEKVPFNVALVLDTSGSITDSLPSIQESAINFVRELKEDDKVMVIDFNSRVNIDNELTSDRNKIRHSINTIHAGGGTKIYDALLEAAKRLKSVEGRKAIILLTDGEDTESNHSETEAIDAVIESGALNYVIQFPSTEFAGGMGMPAPTFPGTPSTFPGGSRGANGSRYPDTTFLHNLSDNTGGDLYYAGGRSGLPNIWHKIAEELRFVYVLGYYPSNPVDRGGKRNIQIQLKDRTNGVLRYKKTYQAKYSKTAVSQNFLP